MHMHMYICMYRCVCVFVCVRLYRRYNLHRMEVCCVVHGCSSASHLFITLSSNAVPMAAFNENDISRVGLLWGPDQLPAAVGDCSPLSTHPWMQRTHRSFFQSFSTRLHTPFPGFPSLILQSNTVLNKLLIGDDILPYTTVTDAQHEYRIIYRLHFRCHGQRTAPPNDWDQTRPWNKTNVTSVEAPHADEWVTEGMKERLNEWTPCARNLWKDIKNSVWCSPLEPLMARGAISEEQQTSCVDRS